MASRVGTFLQEGTEEAVSQDATGDQYHYLPWVDLICAGVPCQDVSVAGKRAGLAGARTGLFYDFARILQELRPTWFVFENVPGLLSSNRGRDFAEVLRVLMVECGYGVCWRVLNSQFFGVAQRRRRLFIVGRFGEPCPAEILFESTCSAGDSKASGEAWEDLANSVTSGIGRVGSRGADDGANLAWKRRGGFGWSESERFSPTIESTGGSHQGGSEFTPLVAHSLRESDGHHGRSSPRGDGCDNLVPTLAIRDERGRCNDGRILEECAHTLHSAKGPSEQQVIAAVAFAENQRGEIRTSNVAPQLSAGGGKPGSGYSAVAFEQNTQCSTPELPSLRANETPNYGVAYALRRDPGGTGQGHNTNYVSSPPDSHGVRDFARLPAGMDSARYRALGNAVTVSVAKWIAERILQCSNDSARTGAAKDGSTSTRIQ